MSKFTTSILCAGTLLLALILNGCLGSQSSEIDRETLIALHNATDGPNWRIPHQLAKRRSFGFLVRCYYRLQRSRHLFGPME